MHQPGLNFSVLIPDSDDHKLLSLQVINCFSNLKNVKIFILSSERNSFLRYSFSVHRFIYLPHESDLEWFQNIDKTVKKFSIDIILPVFEIGIEKILEHKASLKEVGKLCPLPSLANFQKAIDKGILYNHLKQNNLPCPQSEVIKPNSYPENIDLKFPIIAKPVKGFGGGMGIRVLYNQKDIQIYYHDKKFSCDTILQEYINGYDICCNVLCERGEIMAYTIQKAGIFNNNGLEPLSVFNFVEDQELLEVLKKLMKSLNWSGVANIDFRYDEDQQIFKVIELNPRFWRNVDASEVTGVNFPYLCILATLNQKFDLQTAKQIDFVDLKGLVKKLLKNPMLVFNITYLRNNSTLFFALRDPLPMIYKFIWRSKNIIVSKFKRN
ncbi:ATP-grasp domain-containing protein [Winogradskyella alexanderae]|uniref:ATP-grasp domain-containing protein n=1 Tax=Winogradskyella alexanderae TaxID=2877123 RepID=A0ABS7XWU1_9FLAO|nr:ATP-grasp domain-containing protein [Winogradskyella alexanderae]MCA0133476.1 ATP-grasp domain-containing protein [Winogradskyella alexanderae]